MSFLPLLAHWFMAAAAVLAIYGMAGRDMLSRRQYPWALPLAAAFVALEFKASFPEELFWDFKLCYLVAGKAVLNHDLGTLTMLYERVAQGFVNMPVIAWIFAPFALFGARQAEAGFALAGLAASIGAWHLLAKLTELGTRERWLLALLFIANGPLINSLKFGNTSHFLLLALVAGLVLLKSGRPAAAGALLAAATIMKPAIGLFGVYFLLRRDWRALSAFASFGLAVSLLSLALFGWSYNRFWFETSILQFGHQWFAGFNVESLPAFILRLRPDSSLLTNWQPVLPTGGEQIAARILILLVYVIAAAACYLGAKCQRSTAQNAAGPPASTGVGSLELQYLLLICLALVASPLSWAHYYCWLLVPAAYFLGPLSPMPGQYVQRITGWASIGLATQLVTWPASFTSSALSAIYRAAFESTLLLAGLLWFALLAWRYMRTGQRVSAGCAA